jgi:CcmD family protein
MRVWRIDVTWKICFGLAARPVCGQGAILRRLVLVLVWVLLMACGPTIVAAAMQPPTRPADEGFVSIDQLPPDEKLPAAPLLIAAYSIAWLVVAFYLWSIWQRLGRVEREIADVSRRVGQGGGPGGGSLR